MSLDELNKLANRIRTFPIEHIYDDIKRTTELIKYTKHSKKLSKHKAKLEKLIKFKSLYETIKATEQVTEIMQ